MRFSAAVVIASLAAFVSAAPVSKAVQSAYFPFTPEGACVSGCTNVRISLLSSGSAAKKRKLDPI